MCVCVCVVSIHVLVGYTHTHVSLKRKIHIHTCEGQDTLMVFGGVILTPIHSLEKAPRTNTVYMVFGGGLF